VESLVQSDSDERCRPDTETGEDEESSANTSDTVPNEITAQTAKKLIAEVVGKRLVEVGWKSLDEYSVARLRSVVGNCSHDSDKHVFLVVELSGVEAVFRAE
jgi:hypothetical protein